MASIESYITGTKKLIEIVGCWPSFHEAEVIDLSLWRGRVKPGDWDDRNVFPVLTVKIHVFRENPDSPRSNHALATLRFEDVDEFKMDGFNHLNEIDEISISVQERGKFENGEDLPPYLVVRFQQIFGMAASFRCFLIEVVDAVRCTAEGDIAS
jgi:hypothetical protein